MYRAILRLRQPRAATLSHPLRSAGQILLAALFGLLAGGAAHAAPAASSGGGGELVIAQSAPFSGPLAPTGSGLRAGAQIYFDTVNAAGGVHGAKLRLVSRDDGYKAPETVRVVRELAKEVQPIAFFGVVGTGNGEALLKEKVLAEVGIPLVTVRSGGQALVKPANPWLFVTRATYADEVKKVVEQFVPIGFQRIAVFYQDDPFGHDGLAAAETYLKAAGASLVAKGSYEKNTTKVDAAVKTIAAADPQAVILVSNTAASAEFMKQLRAAGNMAQLVALSVTDGPQVAKLIGNATARGLSVVQVVPDPLARTTPLSRELADAFKRFPPKDIELNHTVAEGYVGAKVLVEALKRAGPNPTPKKVRDALETLKDFDVGGLILGFSSTNHAGSRYVDITILNQDGRLLR